MQLWKGRFSKGIDPKTNDFNSSISIDSRMFKEDISGSIAHATMLGNCGIIPKEDTEKIIEELHKINEEIENGNLQIDPNAEDIHTFIEGELTGRIGTAGKRLHTARSRNDQVATDTRLYLREECGSLMKLLKELCKALILKAEEYSHSVMPGYTHLQRAQPVSFGHHMLAYCEMFARDIERIEDAKNRMNYSPLGCGALAGTTYPIDRWETTKALGFKAPMRNSLDGVSDRDFCAEIAFATSLTMVHLSRLSEEIIFWCSWECKFIELDDAFATGSSIMPQKKNPDITELVRGKTGRVIGDVTTLLTMLKGLPLAYNKDMQEDKEATFDAVDTLKLCLTPFIPMISTMKVNEKNLKEAASKGFINATDCADYLVTEKGIAFRDAYKITGELVALCIEKGESLDSLELSEYKKIYSGFDEKVYSAIDLDTCLRDRTSLGGPAPQNVINEITVMKERLGYSG